ncbi:MAG: NUDIX hydrolase [Pseudomonadota bacterium]|nr:NUDIX hydrolase [Pseudomonadota bacterium]
MKQTGGEFKVIEAAGGLVWRNSPRGPELAVIHRARHGDWSLPKGKLDRGESWQAAALREVAEETGCAVRLADFVGSVSYLVNGVPKVVLYWNMQLRAPCAFRPVDPTEVDDLRWLTVAEALATLSHDGERRLLGRQAAA